MCWFISLTHFAQRSRRSRNTALSFPTWPRTGCGFLDHCWKMYCKKWLPNSLKKRLPENLERKNPKVVFVFGACERGEADRGPCGSFFSSSSYDWMDGLMDGWIVRGRLAPSVQPSFFFSGFSCLFFFPFLSFFLLAGYMEHASAAKRSEAASISFSFLFLGGYHLGHTLEDCRGNCAFLSSAWNDFGALFGELVGHGSLEFLLFCGFTSRTRFIATSESKSGHSGLEKPCVRKAVIANKHVFVEITLDVRINCFVSFGCLRASFSGFCSAGDRLKN